MDASGFQRGVPARRRGLPTCVKLQGDLRIFQSREKTNKSIVHMICISFIAPKSSVGKSLWRRGHV